MASCSSRVSVAKPLVGGAIGCRTKAGRIDVAQQADAVPDVVDELAVEVVIAEEMQGLSEAREMKPAAQFLYPPRFGDRLAAFDDALVDDAPLAQIERKVDFSFLVEVFAAVLVQLRPGGGRQFLNGFALAIDNAPGLCQVIRPQVQRIQVSQHMTALSGSGKTGQLVQNCQFPALGQHPGITVVEVDERKQPAPRLQVAKHVVAGNGLVQHVGNAGRQILGRPASQEFLVRRLVERDRGDQGYGLRHESARLSSIKQR